MSLSESKPFESCARARSISGSTSWPSWPTISTHPRRFVPRQSPAWLTTQLAQRERLLALASAEQPALRNEALRSLRGVALTDDQRSRLRASSRGDAASLELVDFPGRAEAPAHSHEPAKSNSGRRYRRLARSPGRARPIRRPASGCFSITKGPGCYRCHQFDGRGSRAGPDLTNLAAGIDRRRLVESIVAPSKEIAPQFVACTRGPHRWDCLQRHSARTDSRRASSSSPIRKAGGSR